LKIQVYLKKIQIVPSIAYGCNKKRSTFFDFRTPFSEGSPLAYPILPNFHASFLHAACSATLQNSMKATALFIGISTVILLHKLVIQFTKNLAAAVLAFPLWCFSGGLGFIFYFLHGSVLRTERCNYIHDFEPGINGFWFQTIVHVFHLQRSTFYAIPMCCLIIVLLYDGVSDFNCKSFVFAAICCGILCQTQIHGCVSKGVFQFLQRFWHYHFRRIYFKSQFIVGLLLGFLQI
jgi:hypothetical protein